MFVPPSDHSRVGKERSVIFRVYLEILVLFV